jgi:hypothetical protein
MVEGHWFESQCLVAGIFFVGVWRPRETVADRYQLEVSMGLDGLGGPRVSTKSRNLKSWVRVQVRRERDVSSESLHQIPLNFFAPALW